MAVCLMFFDLVTIFKKDIRYKKVLIDFDNNGSFTFIIILLSIAHISYLLVFTTMVLHKFYFALF